MRRFRVRTTRRAETDAEAIYRWIAEGQGHAIEASRWLEGLAASIASLDLLPLRCPLAPESAAFGSEIHQLVFRSHRVLFAVDGEEVVVLHVRHGRRRPATRGELGEIESSSGHE